MVARINPITGARTTTPRLLDYLRAFATQAAAPAPRPPSPGYAHLPRATAGAVAT